MADPSKPKHPIAPQDVKRIGLVGCGTVGSAWAAHFLAQGLDVIATDPSPNAEIKMRQAVDNAWPSLVKLGLATDASRERLHFNTAIDSALHTVDFVQESTPEQESIKDQVMHAISNAAPPEVIIASSTSGIIPTRLQAQVKHPQRMIVGHPFNPVYLIPLVEVVGGKHTSAATLEWAMAFYQHWGKSPLHCRTEIPGHLANRLQDAVIGEMLNLVADGYASSSDMDIALSAGPGLRWALMGSFMTGYMGAGEGGYRAVFEGKFGEPESYMPFPDLKQNTIDTILAATDSQVQGHDLQTLEKIRDEFLVGVLTLRASIEKKYGFNQSRFLNNSTE